MKLADRLREEAEQTDGGPASWGLMREAASVLDAQEARIKEQKLAEAACKVLLAKKRARIAELLKRV